MCKMGGGKKKPACWIQASGSRSQLLDEEDVPTLVVIDTTDGHDEHDCITLANNAFTVHRDGDYLIVAAPQVGRLQTGPLANFRCWLRVNGVDVPNSNVLMNLDPDGATKDVIISQGIVSLKKNDAVTVMAATDSALAGVSMEAIQPTPNEPLVPSIIFTMHSV
jgi:hypothetical protein